MISILIPISLMCDLKGPIDNKWALVQFNSLVSNRQQVIIWTNADPVYRRMSWWRHQMETFSALLALCAGNSPISGEFPAQRPVMRSFDVFFDLSLINGWVNTREAGDLRRYRAHYDVIVM